jgi:nucleotide-binding universal stress UspA family protein
MLRALLIAVDLSAVSDRVIGRAALLPLAEDARLTLLHVVSRSLPVRDRRRAEQDARQALEADAEHLKRSLPRDAAIRCVVKVGAPATAIVDVAKSVKAELIVMGRGGGRVLRDDFIGSTAERVIRRGQVPVLVVRLPPRAAYRKPAIALDLDAAAPSAVALLLRVVPTPSPSVAVIHALDPPYHGLIYPSLAADDAHEYRSHYQHKARSAVAKLLSSALAHTDAALDAPRWRTHVQFGSPRSVVQKAAKKSNADLLVLGTRAHSGITYAFLGTVAGDVLRAVTCDVLMVPPLRVPKAAR